MIDILVYLFENYQPDACPGPSVLAKKLTAAGFEAEDISAALSWLDGLAGSDHAGHRAADPRSIRIYDESEASRLTPEALGFIAFLEQQGAVNPALRETIIERALALPGHQVGVDRLKIIVLAVIWRRQQPIDALILEELLAEDLDEDDEDFVEDEDTRRILLN